MQYEVSRAYNKQFLSMMYASPPLVTELVGELPREY